MYVCFLTDNRGLPHMSLCDLTNAGRGSYYYNLHFRGGRELEVTCLRPYSVYIMWLHFHPGFHVSKFHVLLTLPHCLSGYVDEMKIVVLKRVTMNSIESLLGPGPV